MLQAFCVRLAPWAFIVRLCRPPELFYTFYHVIANHLARSACLSRLNQRVGGWRGKRLWHCLRRKNPDGLTPPEMSLKKLATGRSTMPPITVADGTRVTMAGHELVCGQTIFPPREADPILDDVTALRARIEEDGYILIRDFFDRDAVMAARREILAHLSTRGFLDPDAPLDDGAIGPDNSGPVLRNVVVVKAVSSRRCDHFRHVLPARFAR